MEQILPFLEGIFFIATTENDQPHVRPFDAAGILDHKLYIGTMNNKQVFAQIKANPKVEIYATNDALGSLRIQAKAYPVEDRNLNQAAYESTKKDYAGDHCAALELKNVRGVIRNKLGETLDVAF